MYWMINESPIVQPDVDNIGASFPLWGDRGNEFKIQGKGRAGLKLDDSGILLIIDEPTGHVMFAAPRKVFTDFADRGEVIYRYSDYIGGLLIKSPKFEAFQLFLPRNLFYDHVFRARELFEDYDERVARAYQLRG